MASIRVVGAVIAWWMRAETRPDLVVHDGANGTADKPAQDSHCPTPSIRLMTQADALTDLDILRSAILPNDGDGSPEGGLAAG